jgi:hypothetical protein
MEDPVLRIEDVKVNLLITAFSQNSHLVFEAITKSSHNDSNINSCHC